MDLREERPGNLHVECFLCGEELHEAGALLFDPPLAHAMPDGSTEHTAKKRHICARCFPSAEQQLLRLVHG